MAGTQVREQAKPTKPAEGVSPYKAITDKIFRDHGTLIDPPAAERRP